MRLICVPFNFAGTSIWIGSHWTDLPGREEYGRYFNATPTGDRRFDDGK